MTTPDAEKKSSKLGRVLQRFMAMEAAGGLVMMASAALALICANTEVSAAYFSFVTQPVTLGIGSKIGVFALKDAVIDILMVLFFMLVGMELKREMCEGALAEKGQKLLPLIAALGGVVVPALIYIAFNHSMPENKAGWAIPTATDIAFALCVLTLLGKKVPPAAKAFLLAIAIYDDLAAVMIIALFYSATLQFTPLFYAVLVSAALITMGYKRVSNITPYVILGIILWGFLHAGGIHTTIAGVVVGVAIPRRGKEEHHAPLTHAIHVLHPWVAYAILPLFAFVSAGVSLQEAGAGGWHTPLALGISLGLFFGKQIGIFLATVLAVTLKLAPKPQGTHWGHIYGVSVVAGVGFTMSLFIGMLAFTDAATQSEVKLGVLLGSGASALLGALVFDYFGRKSVASH